MTDFKRYLAPEELPCKKMHILHLGAHDLVPDSGRFPS